MSSPIEQALAPQSRRERRELEREAELREMQSKLEAKMALASAAAPVRSGAESLSHATAVDTQNACAADVAREPTAEPVFLSRRERREAELAAAKRAALTAASKVERAAETSLPKLDSAEVATAQVVPALDAAHSEPVFMSRRERREAERRAAELAVARLEAQSARAAELAVARNPELFAKPSKAEDQRLAPVSELKPATEADEVFLPEAVDTAAIETLDVSREPVVLAPVVSLDDVRAARAEAADIVPVAPSGEPEVEVPEVFLSKRRTDRPERIKRDSRVLPATRRYSGNLVALSFVAGTVVLGAGSVAGFSMVNSNATASESVSAETVATQSLQVGTSATEPVVNTRTDEITAVTAIGSAAAANLATGVQLPDSKAFTNNITANVQWPFPMGVQISSEYGYRDSPTAGASSQHGGVDFTPGLGTPIGSIAEGIVTDVDLAGGSGSGIYVEIEHMIEGQRVTSVYAHLKPDSVVVKEGQAVAVGDEIAQVGSTGISTGPHLHLEIHLQGKYVDPAYFLKKLNVSGVSTEVPSADDGKSIALGGDEKLTSEDSHALIDELFAKIG